MTHGAATSLRRLSLLVVTVAFVAFAAAGSASSASGLGPVITQPEDGYAQIHALLRSPRHSLDLVIYELRDAEAQQALVADAARGVKVRVLLDRAGAGGPINQPAFDDLKAHGVEVSWASTKVALTHEKSFVIDRKKAVIMTGNLTSKYYATGREFAIVDTKAKDVAAIEAAFELDWADKQGTPGAGKDLIWSPGAESQLVGLIASAKHTLRVENEEMKEPAISAALEAAAKRGVEVDVLMTNQPNWKAALNELKAAGVHVRTYALKAPLYIHAKAMVVDSRRVFVGSQNFSVRSLLDNRELGLITTTKSIVNAVQATLVKDFSGATPW